MKNISECCFFEDCSLLNNLKLAEICSSNDFFIHCNIRREVCKRAWIREIEMELYLGCGIWLQGIWSRFHVLGHLDWDGSFRDLVEKREIFCEWTYVCDDDLAHIDMIN